MLQAHTMYVTLTTHAPVSRLEARTEQTATVRYVRTCPA